MNSNYVESILLDFQSDPKPDYVIMNSTLWDINRYGEDSVPDFKINVIKLLKRMVEILSPSTTFLWLTTTEIGQEIKVKIYHHHLF